MKLLQVDLVSGRCRCFYADSVEVNDGHLLLTDDDGGVVAIFAPGTWQGMYPAPAEVPVASE